MITSIFHTASDKNLGIGKAGYIVGTRLTTCILMRQNNFGVPPRAMGLGTRLVTFRMRIDNRPTVTYGEGIGNGQT